MKTKKVVKKPVPVTKVPNTNVILAVDCSGSMDKHVDGLRQVVRTMLKDFVSSPSVVKLSVILFGVDGRAATNGIEQAISDTLAKEVNVDRLVSRIHAWGNTPLCEASTQACKLADLISGLRPNDRVIVTILTDGEATDRNSHQSSLEAALSKLRLYTSNVTVTAMVPNQRGADYMTALGLDAGNVVLWDTTKELTEDHEASKVLRTSYNSYLNSSDKKATGFFSVNLTDTKIDKVKSKLKDLRKSFRALKVDREQPIKDFVESKGLEYVRGSAFYELTKDETVQPYKELLLQERGRKRVYGGEDARKVLGFPKGLTVKVTPGNHQNFKIFIQSTSTNRKLVRGTELLFNLQP